MRKYRDFILDYLHLPVLKRLKQVVAITHER